MDYDFFKTITYPKYWNYFLSLERDFDMLSRYIEFCTGNYSTYSIDIARQIIATCSEVEVIAKEICYLFDNNFNKNSNRNNMDAVRKRLLSNLPELQNEHVYLNRYLLSSTPFINWQYDQNPDWWVSYNHVKHNRSDKFFEANLLNLINSTGGLFILNFYFYKTFFQKHYPLQFTDNSDVFYVLKRRPVLLELDDSYYPGTATWAK